MRGYVVNASVDLVTEQCCNCGMVFAMTSDFQRRCKEKPGRNGMSFYCPAGHGQHYTGETEADKLRRERDRLAQRVAEWQDEAAQQRDRREAAERSAAAFKGQVTKLRKRAAHGVCPCCTRTFTNLQRHMATKHPEFVAEEPT